MHDDALHFVALGGLGEVGMNCALFGHKGRYIVLDCGVSFPDDDVLGVDQMAPDFSQVGDLLDAVEGVVITHGHQDHIGALPLLCDDIDAPVYAPGYAAGLIRHQLAEAGFSKGDVELHAVREQRTYHVGPFEVEFVRVNHSVPDTFAIVLRCEAGTFVHSADFKLDAEPYGEPAADEARFREIGAEGVRALFSDSTNAEQPGRAGSERTVRDAFVKYIAECDQRVVVTCFSTNLFRVQALAEAAEASGRSLVLLGRSLQRNVGIGRELGVIDIPSGVLVNSDEAHRLPPRETILVCTGSQANPRAALRRIAGDGLVGIQLGPGDKVIFSARPIPGNEASIARLKDDIARRGAELIEDGRFHVSGHGYRDDQRDLIRWLEPELVVPVHGDYRFLTAHAELAHAQGVEHTRVLENGHVLEITPHDARVVDRLDVETLAVDKTPFGTFFGPAMKLRKRIAQRGLCIASVGIDAESGRVVEDVELANLGLFDASFDDGLMQEATVAIRRALRDLPKAQRRRSARVTELLRKELIRFFRSETGRKPYVHPVVVYL